MTPSPTTTPDFTEKSERLSETGLLTFFRIADHWGLNRSERRVLLGSIPESTFHKYVKSPGSARLSRDTLERISHLVGIFKSLNIILPRPEAADGWVRRPNSAALFKGSSALDYMMRGNFEDLVAVRRYLDDARGW